MAHHLVWAAHAHCPAAVVVLEIAVDALGTAALVVAQGFRRFLANQVLALVFLRQMLFQRRVAAGVDVNKGDMAQRAAVLVDFWNVIGAVHQVIAGGQAAGGQGGERDGHLAVVHRGGGQEATDRDIAIGCVNVQLV